MVKHKNKQTNQIWTIENHAEHICSQKFIEQKVDYIHNNPVRAGIVLHPEDYLYSSARNYAELDNLIDVIRIDSKMEYRIDIRRSLGEYFRLRHSLSRTGAKGMEIWLRFQTL